MGTGIFITLEGIEGSGKTTQVELLKDLLTASGFEVLLTREPGGSPIGEKIRHILLDTANAAMEPLTELFLYEASRTQHVEEVIGPALKAGKAVLCDRFYDASTAYQGYARGIGAPTVADLNLVATAGKKPDLTIVLDLPVSVGLKRLGQNLDRIEGETTAFHEKVRKGYLEIAKAEPERVKVVDASGPPEEIFAKVKTIVEDLLPLKKAR
ncbi:MAG: dTMP kinase [Candidatus Eisenbacteria bacterium]